MWGTGREKQLLRFDVEKTPTKHLSINPTMWMLGLRAEVPNVAELDLIGVVAH